MERGRAIGNGRTHARRRARVGGEGGVDGRDALGHVAERDAVERRQLVNGLVRRCGPLAVRAGEGEAARDARRHSEPPDLTKLFLRSLFTASAALFLGAIRRAGRLFEGKRNKRGFLEESLVGRVVVRIACRWPPLVEHQEKERPLLQGGGVT